MVHRSRLPVDPTRTCIDCDGAVSVQSKTGLCRRCACLRINRDPAVRAKAGASLSHTYATNPQVRDRHVAGCRRGSAARLADPAKRERMVQRGHEVAALRYSSTRTPEQRERDVKARLRAALAWCPEEYWELNRLLKRKGLNEAERREVILAEVPGTAEHARRQFANHDLNARLRVERERAQAY